MYLEKYLLLDKMLRPDQIEKKIEKDNRDYLKQHKQYQKSWFNTTAIYNIRGFVDSYKKELVEGYPQKFDLYQQFKENGWTYIDEDMVLKIIAYFQKFGWYVSRGGDRNRVLTISVPTNLPIPSSMPEEENKKTFSFENKRIHTTKDI